MKHKAGCLQDCTKDVERGLGTLAGRVGDVAAQVEDPDERHHFEGKRRPPGNRGRDEAPKQRSCRGAEARRGADNGEGLRPFGEVGES